MCFEPERKKTEGEERLEEIIGHTELAEQHLRRASEVAEKGGDNDGAAELAEEADAVEKTDKKFKGIRDRNSG